jgi:PAS domain S-box-containing protein
VEGGDKEMISGGILELVEGLSIETLVLESMVEGVSVSDENGIILYTNEAEDRIFGRDRGELIHQQLIRRNISNEKKAEIINETNGRLRIAECWDGEFIYRKNDGTLLTAFARITVLEYKGKKYCIRIQEDITERKRGEEAQFYAAAIVESSDDAIISKTLQGAITSWNKGAERLFGYTAAEIVGEPINRLIPSDRQGEEVEILERLRRGERIEHFETVRVRKDGTAVDLSLTISPIKDSSGRIIGTSKVARDISERKRADMEREELLMREKAARAEAQAANRSKDQFISLISHELRSPLNSILGYNRILRSKPHDEAQVSRICEIIENNARTQLRLIEDLLDTARIISGKLRLDMRLIDIVPLLAASLDVMRPVAETKSIELLMQCDPSPELIMGDAVRLQQIICNLLSNAIKFTPIGGQVELRLEHSGDGIEIVVSDTGRGIEPEFLPFIFNRNSQADSSGSQRQGGLGLGLALVKHLVEMHGGTIKAASEGAGRGSTFTVTLSPAAR